MKALLRHIKGITSGTHSAPEKIWLPFHASKGCQGTIHYMSLQDIVQLHRSPTWTGCDPPPQGPNPQAQGQWKDQASLHSDVLHEILHITVYLSICQYIPVYTSLYIVYTGIYMPVQSLGTLGLKRLVKRDVAHLSALPRRRCESRSIYQSVHSIYRYIQVYTRLYSI